MRIFKIKTILFISFFVGFLLVANFVLASTIDGTVDLTYKYAWTENAGWLNFGTAEGNVHITDSALTGYVWGENIGWISLNCSNDNTCSAVDYKVANDGNGNLSGYAFSENTGWINFKPIYGGVSINSSGEFLGYAWGENIGWIVFNCATTNSCASVDYKVKTDWRPKNSREEKEIVKPPVPKKVKPPTDGALKPPVVEPVAPPEGLIPKEAPLSMEGKWQLLPAKAIREFVLAPLPSGIKKLANKLPDLGRTLGSVGVVKITDIEKLKNVKLTLRGLTESLGLSNMEITPGQLALVKGASVAKLSPKVKEKIPSEIIFVKTADELIDFNITLTVNEKGEPEQEISADSSSPLQLVIKPEKGVRSVKGYIVFKSGKSQTSAYQASFSQLASSLMLAKPVFAQAQEAPASVEEKLVLGEFVYTDPDGDGIYMADIQTPSTEGEYEIITVIDYEDAKIGKKEIRLTTIIDPEGYIYEKDGDKETRIPGAIVSLFWLNTETKQYELWPAKVYQQENPQITDATGKYVFLVPDGSYYLKVEAPSYLVYDGKPFQVQDGSGIHININLKTKYWWLKIIDWKTAVLVVVIILLIYNFYRDKIREKFIRKS